MYIAKSLMIVFVTAFMLTATDAMAKDTVYRWVDDKGIVHFGDRPDMADDAEVVEGLPTEPTNNQSGSQSGSQSQSAPIFPVQEEKTRIQLDRERRMEYRKEAQAKADEVAAACTQRRQIVTQLEPSTRVMVRGEDGEVYRLDDNERLKALDEAKAYIANSCNN